MARTADKLETLDFNAIELKALTEWDESVVIEFLNYLRNFVVVSDAVDESTERSDEISEAIANSILNVSVLPKKYVPDTEKIDADYQTAGDHRLACINDSGSITVTLNDTPDDSEKVSITRTRDQVVLNGNGKNINGDATVTLAAQYVSLQVEYILEIDEWIIS